jgi:phage-related minor tail protein
MGEAGPEAIMPLKRGPDGSLGIQSHGKSGGGNTVTVNVTTVVNSDGTASSKTDMQGDEARLYAKFGEEMRNIAEQHLQRSLMPNGTLYNAGITSGA